MYDVSSGLNSTAVLMDHVNFIVDNTFYHTKQGVLKRQKNGLPMGTNSAPEMANLTCYIDERDFVDKLVQEDQIDEARDHSDNFRFQDDTLTWNVQPPNPELYGMEWSETTLPQMAQWFI